MRWMLAADSDGCLHTAGLLQTPAGEGAEAQALAQRGDRSAIGGRARKRRRRGAYWGVAGDGGQAPAQQCLLAMLATLCDALRFGPMTRRRLHAAAGLEFAAS